MEISVTAQGQKAQVAVLGIIDDGGAEEIKRTLGELNRLDIREVEIDFEHVTFIGSTGIGKLLALYRGMAERGGSIRLRNVPSDIHNMFRLVNLDKLFSISSDL